MADALIVAAWPDGRKWLPHDALEAFAKGGTQVLPLDLAGLVVAIYALVFVVCAGALFRIRDVST